MEYLVEEAFRITIATEKRSHELYHHAAVMLPEGLAKDVLHRLAQEEGKIVSLLVERCPYPIQTVIGEPDPAPVSEDPALLPQQRRLLNLLRLALVDKRAAVTRYQTFLQVFRDPAVCSVFQLALEHSRALLLRIADEYRQADLTMRGSSVNRRLKRAHIRTSFARKSVPNKHSQPFISMLDFGRHYPF